MVVNVMGKCTEFSTRSMTGGEQLPPVTGENSGTRRDRCPVCAEKPCFSCILRNASCVSWTQEIARQFPSAPKESPRAKRAQEGVVAPSVQKGRISLLASHPSMTGGGRFLFEEQRVGILIACRMKSARLPKKALLPIVGKPMIDHLIERVKTAKLVDEVVLCTSTHPDDAILEEAAQRNNIPFFRGSEEDVMGRFIAAAEKYHLDLIVRVTGDNPLTDPEYIDRLITSHLATGADFSKTEQLPIGLNSEVFSLGVLKRAHQLADDPNKSEYMTAYLKQPKYFTINILGVDPEDAHQEIRLTVDYQQDLDLMNEIYSSLSTAKPPVFSVKEIIKLLTIEKPELVKINSSIEERPLPRVSLAGEIDPTLQNVVIVGADLNGRSGEIIAHLREKKLFNIIGLLDDREQYQYLQFDGLPVLGRVAGITKEKLPLPVQGAFIGLQDKEAVAAAVTHLRKAGIPVLLPEQQ